MSVTFTLIKLLHGLAKQFGLHRETVSKMLRFSVPSGYRRNRPARRPKLDPFVGIIDRILEEDHLALRKQRHMAKRISERLRQEYGFEGGYTIVKDYLREHRRRSREVFVPLAHDPGHAQVGKRPTGINSHFRGHNQNCCQSILAGWSHYRRDLRSPNSTQRNAVR